MRLYCTNNTGDLAGNRFNATVKALWTCGKFVYRESHLRKCLFKHCLEALEFRAYAGQGGRQFMLTPLDCTSPSAGVTIKLCRATSHSLSETPQFASQILEF